jgi:uncharacterized membrane protein
MKYAGAALLLGLFLLAPIAPCAFSSEYISKSLTAFVYADGTATISYGVDVDPSLARVTISLFGSTLTDLFVVNELGIPLVSIVSGSNITVDSLGSSKLTFTYSTPDLTSKIGILWTLNVTSPANFLVTMPSGATIVSMSLIPLSVKNVDERTQITLPPGKNQVSYVVSATAVKDHAESIIQDAEAAIERVKDKGVIAIEAEYLLAQAKTAFNATEYLSAEQYAIQAEDSALNTEEAAQVAKSAIQDASIAVQTAKNEGRTSNLAEAEASLADAQSKYSTGAYSEAKSKADVSYASASTSKSEVNYVFIIGGAVAITLATVGILIYYKRRKEEPSKATPAQQATSKRNDDDAVNLEAIFKKHTELRVDDKEVLRFIAEHRGQVFANEIRDRFDIPRTSTWRMIRRLISMGILEEKKIGGQSLISVVKKYREAQD